MIFRQKLIVGPGNPPGSANILPSTCHYPEAEWMTLTPPDLSWRLTLDCNFLTLWPANNPNAHRLQVSASNSYQLIVEPDGLLHVINPSGRDLWRKGPFGPSAAYELVCEAQGDVALYNAAGTRVWSAIQNGG